MDYLLDTNTISFLLEGNESVVRRLERVSPADNVYSSVICEGELRFGALRAPAPRGERLKGRIDGLLASLAGVVPVTRAAAEAYSEARAALTAEGRPIADNDLWIAAVALANDYVLVSHDDSFRRIMALRLEDWVTAR